MIDEGDLAADRARLHSMRCHLGAQLARYRTAAGVSQPELGQALGRTRSAISKVENGRRGMPETLWTIADEVCRAGGALVAGYNELADAERDYRGRCRARRRAARRAAAQAEVDALAASPAPSSAALQVPGGDAWPDMALVSGELAGELMQMIKRLVRSLGRRDAIRLVSWMLTAVGASGLNPDEYLRVARAVEAPGRVDPQVIKNLAITLAHCKRQEDMLGPCQVLDTVVAQHQLVRRMIKSGCSERMRKPLCLINSNMASTIGGYLVDTGQPDKAKIYFGRARRAAHDAGNATYAAYAAINTGFAAFVLRDTPTALDSAAAARSLAARTDDPRLKALAEQIAAAAYALDDQYGPCMAACDRAHDLLTRANGSVPDSPAYWMHHGTIDSQRSTYLALLSKPKKALDAASNARRQYDRTYVGRYALCEVRLGHALVLSHEINEAARILGDAASHAHLFPRLTGEFHAARTLMQPWENTHAVKTLDTQLHAYGLLPLRSASILRPDSNDRRV